MKKLVLAIGLMLCYHVAHAGMVGNMIIADAIKNSGQGVTITSDKYDVLACPAKNNKCDEGAGYFTTPELYARHNGYSKVIKTGRVLFPNGTQFITMEVSK